MRWSSTTIMSACKIVESRCAMQMVVRPFISSSSAACTARSDSVSSALVASSRTRIGAFFKTARAMAMRWRWPPESETPFSPMTAVEAFRFLHDEFVGVGVARGGDDFLVGRAEPAQFDVPADGVVEQNVFLRDDGDLVAQIARGNLAQIHAADFDGAARGVVKAQEQIGERGFAGAAGADERDELAGFDGEIDAVQHGFFAVVEIDVFKLDVGVGRRGAFSARRVRARNFSWRAARRRVRWRRAPDGAGCAAG